MLIRKAAVALLAALMLSGSARAEFLLKQADALPQPALRNSALDVANALFGDGGKSQKPDTKLEKLHAALRDLDHATEIQPDNLFPYLDRARLRAAVLELPYSRQEWDFDGDAPLADYKRVQEIDRTFAAGWFGAALFRAQPPGTEAVELSRLEGTAKEARTKEIRAAIADFSRAIYCALNRGGEAHYRRAMLERQLPSPDANTLVTDLNIAIEQKMTSSALFWSSGLDEEEALCEVYTRRAEILAGRGIYTQALADLADALKIDESADLHFLRGKLRVRRGEYDGAIADMDEVVKFNPRFPDAFFWRGVARDGKGEIEAAHGDFQAAIKLDGGYAKRLAGTRYDAQNPTQRGVAPKPNTQDTPQVPLGTALEHKKAGNMLRLADDDDGALAEYNTALLIDPNFADALNNRGALYREAGKLDLALADLNRAIENDAKLRAAYSNRALVWHDLGEATRERADREKGAE